VNEGAVVLTGGLGADVTTAVAAEGAPELPALFDPVTNERIVDPTSAEASKYVDAAAPEINEQFAPPVSQRCHAYANVGAGEPVQLPVDVLNVIPCCAVPDTTGATVFTGATAPDDVDPPPKSSKRTTAFFEVSVR
jgi:hypothetical protein